MSRQWSHCIESALVQLEWQGSLEKLDEHSNIIICTHTHFLLVRHIHCRYIDIITRKKKSHLINEACGENHSKLLSLITKSDLSLEIPAIQLPMLFYQLSLCAVSVRC